MKLAILIFGRINLAASFFYSILATIDNEHDIDFFLSSDCPDKDDLNNFINLYRPVSYINTKTEIDLYYDDFNKYNRGSVNLPNMISHFINKKRVFELMEEHIKNNSVQYDCVMSLRTDLIFQNNFKFNFNNLIENTIYIPSGNDYGGINDQFAYGKIEPMKIYMYIIDNVLYLCSNDMPGLPPETPQDGMLILHPETLTIANIYMNNLKISRFDVNYFITRH